eukprot:1194787-Prorocentrum_minimum.AAC.2
MSDGGLREQEVTVVTSSKVFTCNIRSSENAEHKGGVCVKSPLVDRTRALNPSPGEHVYVSAPACAGRITQEAVLDLVASVRRVER